MPTTERGGVPTSVPPSTPAVVQPASATAAPVLPQDKVEIPWAFIDCPMDILVEMAAHILELLCMTNDQVLLTRDTLTRFHSRAPPGISIVEYLRRIVRYTNLEKIPLLSLLAYIDRTCQNLPTFALSSLTVHRFLIAGVTAGSKGQCDVFCTNSHYAKVGGIKVTELNSLEREFLRVTGWALSCTPDLLQEYYTSLIVHHGGYKQAPEPEVSPFLAFPDAGKAQSVPPTPQDSTGDEPEHEEPSDAGSADEAPDAPEALEAPRGRTTVREVEVAMDVDSPPVQPKVDGRLKTFVGGLLGRPDTSDKGDDKAKAKDPAATDARPLTTKSIPVASPAASPALTGELRLTPRIRTRDERSVDSIIGTDRPCAVEAEDAKRRARVE